MLHLLHISIRVLAGLAGVLFIYAAIFLYEDEQGKLQNRLEQWWIEISDRELTVPSRYAAFMQEVAKVAAEIFDRLLGDKLFSWHAFKASSFFSIGSYLLFMSVGSLNHEDLTRGDIRSLLLPLLVALPLFWYGSHRLKIWWPGRFLIHLLAVTLVVTIFFGFVLYYQTAGWVIILASFICDFAFITITRQTLRWCSRMDRLLPIVLMLLINCVIALAFLVGPVMLYQRHNQMLVNPTPEEMTRGNWFVAGHALAGLNAVDALAASLFVVLALVAILHRVVWPVLGRAVYALQEMGIARRRKLMCTLGVLLLTHAGLNIPEQIKKIAELLSG